MLTAKVAYTDRGLERIKRDLAELQRISTFVGLPGDLGQHKDTTMSIAAVAAVQEFGSVAKSIPPRPFMSTTAKDGTTARQLQRLKQSAYKQLLAGERAPKAVLLYIGEYYIGALKRILTTGPWVPLSNRTLLARRRRSKGSSRPLVDTAQMRNSITQRIRQDK